MRFRTLLLGTLPILAAACSGVSIVIAYAFLWGAAHDRFQISSADIVYGVLFGVPSFVAIMTYGVALFGERD